MKEIIEIDAIDRKIISIMQSDSSKSIQTIADQVNLTVNPCWRRIKRLEQAGIFGKRTVQLHHAKLGLRITAFIMLRTDQHSAAWLDQFTQAVNAVPEIVECHRMTGSVDYLLKVFVRDLTHHDQVYQRLIGLVPSLVDVSSTFSMENLKPGAIIESSTY
ncbi:transcriptional regulator [Arenicella chitinivorans]|uniref:Transcriptional regulator n=1 Tax=Arenicella chitinivorans TaxID=1329800 RepID=A0A918RXW5_9GAMM|nr:Lrp/AsnC family transcriptional regulator [Arenicella chitinivorans]GHA13552.1 transcriptional regulator [Arenicella chitinivorans]